MIKANSPSRKLAVILHADVVGSTVIVQKNESIAHVRMQEAFQRFSRIIDDYSGITHEIRGDALVAEFARASDAVCAAVLFQGENLASATAADDEIQPVLRIGISLGEVVIADGTVTGAGVVLAQRLEQLASDGGVVVQGAISETVPTRMPFQFESMGEQQLKGFEQPVRAFTVSLKSDCDLPQPEVTTNIESAKRDEPTSQKKSLSAILVADVVGYSALMARNDTATIEAIKEHRAAIGSHIEHYRGKVADMAGDSILASFPNTVNAVECAVAIQRMMLDRLDAIAAQQRMEFRIGISLEEVIEDEGRLYGNGVNITSRIEAIAPPGGLCLTGIAREAIDGKIDLKLVDLGWRNLKNIPEQKQVFAWHPQEGTALGLTSKKFREQSWLALPESPSIAVLPFTSSSNTGEAGAVGEMLTDGVITTLAKASGMFVIARDSVEVLDTDKLSIQWISRQLGVRYVLQSKFYMMGNRIRATVRLVDGGSGQYIWADRYDRETNDLFDLQDSVAARILEACQVQLTEGEQARVFSDHGGDANLQCIEYYWQGVAAFRQFDRHGNETARRLMEQCLQEDKDRVMYHEILGYTFVMDARAGWAVDREESLVLAEHHAERIAEIESTTGIDKGILANVAQLRGQYNESVSLAQEWVLRSPGSADAYYVLGIMLNYADSPDEAIEAMRNAMRLSPNYPVGYLYQMGLAYYLAVEMDSARTAFIACVEKNPSSHSSYVWLATIEVEQGNIDDARSYIKQAVAIDNSLSIEAWMATELFQSEQTTVRIRDALTKAGLS